MVVIGLVRFLLAISCRKLPRDLISARKRRPNSNLIHCASVYGTMGKEMEPLTAICAPTMQQTSRPNKFSTAIFHRAKYGNTLMINFVVIFHSLCCSFHLVVVSLPKELWQLNGLGSMQESYGTSKFHARQGVTFHDLSLPKLRWPK